MKRRSHKKPETCPRRQLPLHIAFKIRLIWMKSIPTPYSLVSPNILREVCCYLNFLPAQTCFNRFKDELLFFDRTALQWVGATLASPKFCKRPATTCVGDRQVFMCGGESRWNKGDSPLVRAYLWENGKLVNLPRMIERRFCPAVYYYEKKIAVYVFGGCDSRYSSPKKSCERYNFLSQSWTSLSDMHEARTEFNVCTQNSVLYLCGGYCTASVESFSLETECFTLLPGLVLPSCDMYFSAMHNSQLVVVTHRYLYKCDLEAQTVTATLDVSPYFEPAFVDNAIVENACVYAYSRNSSLGYLVNLETGAHAELPQKIGLI